MRRRIFTAGLASAWVAYAQQDDSSQPAPEARRNGDAQSDRLPNGKSRTDAVAAEQHKKALEEADELVRLSQDLREQIAGNGKYVVSVQALRRTEEIEKLARKIRGRLKE